ncbi:MAG: hypothetical protein R2771_15380 [Saprospiraceae bacterium]
MGDTILLIYPKPPDYEEEQDLKFTIKINENSEKKKNIYICFINLIDKLH